MTMKLIKLSCNQESFRTIEFNETGLTLILGTKSDKEKDDTSSSVNGVGKTQALRLVHFCLGSKNNSDIAKTLKHAVPSWLFRLDFTIDNKPHYVERSGNSSILRLDGESTSYLALIRWLDESRIFPKLLERKFVSFRSLFSRFARSTKEDCIEPTKLFKETEYTSLINTAYLLALDLELIEKKYQLKAKIEANRKTKALLSKDSYLADMFQTGINPVGRKKALENNIEQLNESLESFSIADDYHEIEKQAEELTKQGREIQRQITALNFKVDNINKSLEQKPDINNQQLLELYSGLEHLFRPEILEHFDAVQNFHDELTVNRISRLEKEKISIQQDIRRLETTFDNVSKQRDSKLVFLKNNHALDEYLSLTKQISAYKEELTHLAKYLSLDDEIKEQNLDLKKQVIDVIERALEYTKTEPLSELNIKFQSITSKIYAKLNSGVFIEVSDSDNNQLTYNVSVELETDSSDGVASSKVLAFDWLIYQYGYHNMQTLWHDNRLFADIDPENLANWFTFISNEIERQDKQYIASININNYDDMKPFLKKENLQKLEESIVLTLKGDKPSNKLMGIDFDKPRKTN